MLTQEDFGLDEMLQRVARGATGYGTAPNPFDDLEDIDPFGTEVGMKLQTDEPAAPFGATKERKIIKQTQEQLTPGSSASFRAADEMSMQKYQSWKRRYGGGDDGTLSGFIPLDALQQVAPGHYLRPDAAKAFKAMRRAARRDGISISITDSYRDYDAQVAVTAAKGDAMTATPGYSNHGWGLALDINVNDPRTLEWLRDHGTDYGFNELRHSDGSVFEPWHYDFSGGNYRAPAPNRTNSKKSKDEPDLTPSKMADPVRALTTSIPLTVLAAMDEADDGVEGEPHEPNEKNVKAHGGRFLKLAPKPMQKVFVAASRKYNVPLGLLVLVAQKESGFDKNAVSAVGAQGVMQIMPLHGLTNPFNVRENILAGARILADYINGMGNVREGLAAYNAGPGSKEDNPDAWARGLAYADSILSIWRNRA